MTWIWLSEGIVLKTSGAARICRPMESMMNQINTRLPALLACLGCGLALLLAGTAQAADIYKTVAADGSIVYTDEPLPGAEKVNVPPVSVAPSREVQTTRPARSVDSDNDREALNALQQRYQGFAITSPSPEENLWGTGQSVRVAVNSPQPLLPGLR